MEDIETCIAHILKRKIPIEWIRYNMFLQSNIYKNIPVLVFRVDETCNPELIENLKKCVSDFQGKVKWKVFKDPLSKKGNYVLTLFDMEEMHRKYEKNVIDYNEKQYFGLEKFQKYCEYAIEDIPLLAKHIEQKMN